MYAPMPFHACFSQIIGDKVKTLTQFFLLSSTSIRDTGQDVVYHKSDTDVFRLWEEAKVPGDNSGRYEENTKRLVDSNPGPF